MISLYLNLKKNTECYIADNATLGRRELRLHLRGIFHDRLACTCRSYTSIVFLVRKLCLHYLLCNTPISLPAGEKILWLWTGGMIIGDKGAW